MVSALSSASRLLAVMPHPDDEAYVAAATLATAAAAGVKVTLLTLSAGEAGGDPKTRRQELERACAHLGVSDLRVWRWPDGAFATHPAEQSVEQLRSLLLSIEPDVILGLGADGVYGHWDHLMAHRWLRAAAATAEMDERLWQSVMPPGWFHPLWRALRRARPALVPKGLTPQDFGAPPAPGDHELLLDDAARALKRAAIASHQSQLRGVEPDDFLMPGLMAPLMQVERWRVARSGS